MSGATGEIGGAILAGLLAANYHVVCLLRNPKKLTAQEHVETIEADMSDSASIKKAGEAVAARHPRVTVLVCNAAIVPQERKENANGEEMQFAVNVRGYYDTINAIAPLMVDGGRISMVASELAYGLDLKDAHWKTRTYAAWDVYASTKQADRILAAGFADRFPKLLVNACHPGVTTSTLSQDLMKSRSMNFKAPDTAEQAASTPLFLATEVKTTRGYFKGTTGRTPIEDKFVSKEAIEELFKFLE